MLTYSGKNLKNGDVNYYQQGPSLFHDKALAKDATPLQEDDHVNIGGIDLLVFDWFKKKLDPLNNNGTWKGFAPRSTFPMTLRNPSKTNI